MHNSCPLNTIHVTEVTKHSRVTKHHKNCLRVIYSDKHSNSQGLLFKDYYVYNIILSHLLLRCTKRLMVCISERCIELFSEDVLS